MSKMVTIYHERDWDSSYEVEVAELPDGFMAEYGGKVDGKLFGEDINIFSKEELLATVNYLIKELERAREDSNRAHRFMGSII